MNRWIRRCAAVALVAVGGLYYAADQALTYTDSAWARAVSVLGGASERPIHDRDCDVERPAAGDEPAVAQAEPAPFPVRDSFPKLPPTEPVELPPARLPGQIVIDEPTEGEVVRAAVMPRLRDAVGLQPLPGRVEESEAELVPMPPVRDDIERMPMPHVEEECERLPSPTAEDEEAECPCRTSPPTVREDTPRTPPAGLPLLETRDGKLRPPTSIKGRDGARPGSEECEPSGVVPQTLPQALLSPRRRHIDTAEFRPSDAALIRTDLRGPF